MNNKNTLTFGFINLLTMVSFICGIYLVVMSERTRFWQETTANVTNVHIKQYKQTNSVRNKTPIFTVVTEYTYHIKGSNYTSDVYGVWQSLKSKFNSTQEVLDWMDDSAYSMGSIITVFVNPSNYKQSVIVQGANVTAYVPFLLGVFLIVLQLYLKNSQIINNKNPPKSLYINNVT